MRVVHVMADGTVRDSLKGVIVPYNENTEVFYRSIAKRILDLSKKGDKR